MLFPFRTTLKKKEFTYRRAISFLLDLTSIEEEGKRENGRVASSESLPSQIIGVHTVNSRYLKVKVCHKLLISQSKSLSQTTDISK